MSFRQMSESTEMYLKAMSELGDRDVAIGRHYQLDQAVLARDVTTALDRLPRGSTAISDFSEHITVAIQQAWIYATLRYGDAQVRSAYLLLAMLSAPTLRNALTAISRQFGDSATRSQTRAVRDLPGTETRPDVDPGTPCPDNCRG